MKIENGRVVVTGGAGFIGSHLVDRLLSAGNEVVVVDDFSSGRRENLAHHAANRRLRCETADVLDEPAMLELLRGANFVFHLATRNVRLSIKRPTAVHDVNATGTLNVLKAAAAAGALRFLYCSSSEVNGTADVVPMSEKYDFKPETIYGASKLAGEYYAQVFHRSGWLQTVIARPHNNYGPREHYEGACGEVIPRFILQALAGRSLTLYGDGGQTRDFTYVTETADFLVRLLECPAAGGGTFNVCRGEEVSVRDLARLICELTESKSEIKRLAGRPSDVLRLFGDPSLLRQVVGFGPEIGIREGLARTVAWFRDHVGTQAGHALQAACWSELNAEPWLEQVEGRLLREKATA